MPPKKFYFNKMNALVIGCGSIGRRHISLLVNKFCVFIVDPNIQKCSEISGEYNVISYGANLKVALQKDYELIIVASPTKTHATIILETAQKNSVLFVEKPLCANLNQALNLKKKLGNRINNIYVGCNMRFHPGVNALSKYRHLIGKVYYAQAYFRHSLNIMNMNRSEPNNYAVFENGTIAHDCIHEIDYLRNLLGDVLTVCGSVTSLGNKNDNFGDFSVIKMDHKNGTKSIITFDYLSIYKKRGCELVGAKGSIEWMSCGKQPERMKIVITLEKTDPVILEQKDITEIYKPFQNQLEHLILAIDGKKNKLQTFNEGLENLRIVEQLKFIK